MSTIDFPETREEYTVWALTIPCSWPQYEHELLLDCQGPVAKHELRHAVYRWIRNTRDVFPDLLTIEQVYVLSTPPQHWIDLPLYTLSIAGVVLGTLEQAKLNEIFEHTA